MPNLVALAFLITEICVFVQTECFPEQPTALHMSCLDYSLSSFCLNVVGHFRVIVFRNINNINAYFYAKMIDLWLCVYVCEYCKLYSCIYIWYIHIVLLDSNGDDFCKRQPSIAVEFEYKRVIYTYIYMIREMRQRRADKRQIIY